MAFCFIIIVVTIVICYGKSNTEPPMRLTRPEAMKLVDEMNERWIELNKKEDKSAEELKLVNSIALIAIYENNVIIVTLTNDDKETIRLFREIILECLDNADAVQFDKGEMPEPANSE